MRPRRPKPLARAPLLDYALRTLSARALSLGELRARLKERAERTEDVEEVLGQLKGYGYLNDRRFAEAFARLRRENQGFGKQRVLRDLRGRRVVPAVAEKAVAEAYGDAGEADLIEQYLRRKLHYSDSRPRLDDPRRIAALYRMLLRAGFSSANILASLRALSAESGWVDSLESAAEQEASD